MEPLDGCKILDVLIDSFLVVSFAIFETVNSFWFCNATKSILDDGIVAAFCG
jgi:hypothetical protein